MTVRRAGVGVKRIMRIGGMCGTQPDMHGMKLLAKKKHVTCYCDFCGSSDGEVPKMVDGKHAFICERCVYKAAMILRPKVLAIVK
jgi:hypothetical protein